MYKKVSVVKKIVHSLVVLGVSFACFVFMWPFTAHGQSSVSDGRNNWQRVNVDGPNSGTQQTASQIFDVDGDGKEDIVLAERTGTPSVVWYKNNGTGTAWAKKTIEPSMLRIEAGGAHHDIDGDGDIDLVFGQDNRGNEMWWWENPSPNLNVNKWTRHTLKNTGGNKHHDSAFGNVDGDAGIELVTWNQRGTTDPNALRVGDIPNNPTTIWNLPVKYTAAGTGSNEHEGLAIADINGDGKDDIVGAGRWFNNGNFAVEVIDNSMKFTRAAVGQIIPGGRPEVVFTPGDADGMAKMYEWRNNAWQAKNLRNIVHGHSLEIVDIDNDGKLDIFIGEMGITVNTPKTYFFYGDGAGNFTETSLNVTQANHESRLADFDNDGDMDLLAKPYEFQAPGFSVYLNQSGGTPQPTDTPGGGLSNWGNAKVVGSRTAQKAIFIYDADINKDGYKDIVAGGYWYKNPGSNAFSGSWQRNTLGASIKNVAAVYDINGDSWPDVLGTNGTHVGTTLFWAPNQNGSFSTTYNQFPTLTGDFLQGVAVEKFNGNTNQVALSWHKNGDGISLLTPPGNPQNQWTKTRISTANQEEDLSTGDIDGDGDLDLLLGTVWLKNNGSTWTDHTLFTTNGHPDRNELADMDGDGKLDSVVGYEAINTEGKLAWYKQGNNPTGLWQENIIASNVTGPMSLDVADLDGDGDQDIVVGEHNLQQPNTARMLVFENTGNGSSWTRHVVGTGYEHHDGAQLSDLDNDGDLDIISIGWGHENVLAYENKNGGGSSPTQIPTTPPTTTAPTNSNCIAGDLDCSGKVNSADLTALLSKFGTSDAAADIDNSGVVNALDLTILLQNFGTGGIGPTNQPTSGPTTQPTNPPTSTQNEIVIFDGLHQHTTNGNARNPRYGFFPELKLAGTDVPDTPPNWESPKDYYNGTWHFRYKIVSNPSGTAGEFQTCIWEMPDFEPETCPPKNNTKHNGQVGEVVTLATVPAEWQFKKHGILRMTDQTDLLIRSVLRGPGGCNVTNYEVVAGRCPQYWDDLKQMKYQITIVAVPKGETFSGWQNY